MLKINNLHLRLRTYNAYNLMKDVLRNRYRDDNSLGDFSIHK